MPGRGARGVRASLARAPQPLPRGGRDRHDGAVSDAGALARPHGALSAVLLFAAIRLRQGAVGRGCVARRAAAPARGRLVRVGRRAGRHVALGAVHRVARTPDSSPRFRKAAGCLSSTRSTELLFEFPFGAGLGRWGMMQVYFGDPAMWQAPPIHVEIQMTGWLLDGGVPMWVCYGGALASAVWFAYRTAIGGGTESIRYFATIVLAVQLTMHRAVFHRCRLQHAAWHPVLDPDGRARRRPVRGGSRAVRRSGARREAMTFCRRRAELSVRCSRVSAGHERRACRAGALRSRRRRGWRRTLRPRARPPHGGRRAHQTGDVR